MIGFAYFALFLSGLNFCVGAICSIARMADIAHRCECRSIGWAIASALFFMVVRAA